jgi:hypothetical protein
MKCIRNWSACGYLVLAAACGGDSDDGGSDKGVVDTGIEETTPLSEVTPAQATQVCDSLEVAVNARFSMERQTRATCEVLGALISANPGSCRDFADQCVSDPPQGLEGMGDLPTGEDLTEAGCGQASDYASCTATIEEYEACVNDQLDEFEQLLQEFGCANAPLDIANFPESQADIPTASSCTAFDMKCPGVLDFESTPQ